MADPKRVRAQAAAESTAAAKWRHVRFRDSRDPSTTGPPFMVGTPDDPRCWCLEPLDHDWPGKADGAPHPRETEGLRP
ncbi:hypothetical protein OG352_05380 [Streptomyces sp. NBC_01485]|uniref:hypothetical protein n=1 Tax=Streptomyces sp. NBC_01485 TaxID=2903884 RepID=UPI002E354C7F|nr:hypothetical protein [Streptomyces sp. NBC_01485]